MVKMSAGWVFSEVSTLGFHTLPSHCVLTWPVCASLMSLCVQTSSFNKKPVQLN